MQLYPGNIYHIYNRGNQQQQVFFNDENYLFFLRKIRKELLPHCDILAYCLMPNHFHWLVYVKSSDDFKSSDDCMTPLSKAIAVLLRSYTRAIQKQQNFTGSLFQQKTKAVEIKSENHILTCANYIHQNPLKAGLVTKMEDWSYSSFPYYIGLRNGTLCNKQLFLDCANVNVRDDFRQLSYSIIPDSHLKQLFGFS
ncbi:MAG: transposase [Chitinophagales bacterium]|nr:transposase [Chitinophagales bacterium]